MEQPPPVLMVSCTRCALFIESRACEFTSQADPICAPCAAQADLEATHARARFGLEGEFILSDAADAADLTLGAMVGVVTLLD